MQREGHSAADPALAAVTDGPDRRAVLELCLSDSRRLFNSMDPAPFRERNLDPEAAAYIVQWAEEVPAARPLGMVLHLGGGPVAAAEARLYDRLGVMDVRVVETNVAASPGDGAAP